MDLQHLSRSLLGAGILLCYNGPITQEVTECVGEALRVQMKLRQAQKDISLRAFACFVELAQNIAHYSKETSAELGEEAKGSGIVAIGYDGGCYFIQAGNVIGRADAPRLQERLGRLDGMNRQELIAYYRERRRLDPGLGSKGAGIGLLELARHASALTHAVVDLDGERSFFSIKVTI